jgi:hypothetical protein
MANVENRVAAIDKTIQTDYITYQTALLPLSPNLLSLRLAGYGTLWGLARRLPGSAQVVALPPVSPRRL